MQKVDLSTSFTKLNANCGLPDFFTDYQIRHLGNPSGLPGILLKIDPSQFAGSSGPVPYTLRVINGVKWVFRQSLSLPWKFFMIAFMHCKAVVRINVG